MTKTSDAAGGRGRGLALRWPRGGRWRPVPVGVAALVVTAAMGAAAGGDHTPEAAAQLPVPFARPDQADEPPPGWSELEFRSVPHATRYRVVEDDGRAVVHAFSDRGGSLLYTDVAADPRRFAHLRWRWKVHTPVEAADLEQKRSDDAAARVCIGFAYHPDMVGCWQRLLYRMARRRWGEFPPYSGICYVWAASGEAGRVIPSPHYERAAGIIAESGTARAGEWVTEERDILQDYRAAFGADPPEISHLAVMTDSDDTGGLAEAWYGSPELVRTGSAGD